MVDIAVGVTAAPYNVPKLTKPPYLVHLIGQDKRKKESQYFISLDKPELLNGFIQVKGIFVDFEMTEEKILSDYASILTDADKALYSDMLIPWHKICMIRNLVFKAK